MPRVGRRRLRRTSTTKNHRRPPPNIDAHWPFGPAVVVPAGTYAVRVGENAATVLHEQAVHLDGDGVEPPLSLQANVGEWLAHPTAGPPLPARMTALMAQAGSDPGDGDRMRTVASLPMTQILNWLLTPSATPTEPESMPS